MRGSEKLSGWSLLEAKIAHVRADIVAGRGYNPRWWREEAIELEAREEFERARAKMHQIGIVDYMQAIHPLLPHTSLKVIDDFDEAGGPGFSPRVTITTPERTLELDEDVSSDRLLIRNGGVITEVDVLNVYPLVFNPDVIGVSVQINHSAKDKDGQVIDSARGEGDRWSRSIDENLLPRYILAGVRNLNLPDIDLTAVEAALNQTSESLANS